LTQPPRAQGPAHLPALVGDIGATNARFALVMASGEIERAEILAVRDFPTIEDAIDAYLCGGAPLPNYTRPRAAAIAVAGPITGDRVALTNHPWSFSTEGLRGHLGLERLQVVNDFSAIACAAPYLDAADCIAVGGGRIAGDMPIGVLGPGTGLGVGGLVPLGGRWRALSGEGGHVTMAPANDREGAVLTHLRRRFDHVSAERAGLSGQGLVNLYSALAELDGATPRAYTPPQITDPETGRHDRHCREAVELFCLMLGTVAADLALTLGARGGIFIAGGIVPELGDLFTASGFRQRFESKGRMQPFLAAIPTFVITREMPAFVGLRALLAGQAE
jgi:glucokinase